MADLTKLSAAPWLDILGDTATHNRELDIEIATVLGWRVSKDTWWNWHPGPRFDPPGDEWCIRKDGRKDQPCNEALPRFTRSILKAELDRGQ